MTNTITAEQLKELLEIQKTFDDRIPTLNLVDSKVAFVVEFFEWFNTLETFKNWKKNPGKPLDVQLDELADLLAFALSIWNQSNYGEFDFKQLHEVVNSPGVDVDFNCEGATQQFLNDLTSRVTAHLNEVESPATYFYLRTPFLIAKSYYTYDELLSAYYNKMQRNHDRQDGKADKDKGYV